MALRAFLFLLTESFVGLLLLPPRYLSVCRRPRPRHVATQSHSITNTTDDYLFDLGYSAHLSSLYSFIQSQQQEKGELHSSDPPFISVLPERDSTTTTTEDNHSVGKKSNLEFQSIKVLVEL